MAQREKTPRMRELRRAMDKQREGYHLGVVHDDLWDAYEKIKRQTLNPKDQITQIQQTSKHYRLQSRER